MGIQPDVSKGIGIPGIKGHAVLYWLPYTAFELRGRSGLPRCQRSSWWAFYHGAKAHLTISPVVVSFPLVDDSSTSLLAWTTTPWTLPSNLALCVNPDYTYIKIEDQERKQNFILHENLLRTLYKDPKKAKFKKLGQYKGSEMKGWHYVPLFDYFVEKVGVDINSSSPMRYSPLIV